MTGGHVPVMVEEILEGLRLEPGSTVVDATVGEGGHAEAILRRMGKEGSVIGFDRDPGMASLAAANLAPFGARAVVVNAHYADMDRHLDALSIGKVNGVLFDLGVASAHLDLPERGFSFRHSSPLDMRFDRRSGETAADILRTWSERELCTLFRAHAEVRRPGALARAIVRERATHPITTTGDLAALVEKVLGRRGGHHPATTVFQALRIAANRELERLPEALAKAVERLRPGGRLAVVAYHSGEDRIVKEAIRRLSATCVCPPRAPVCTCDAKPSLRPVGRRASRPSPDEVSRNPRARSARLRIAERLS